MTITRADGGTETFKALCRIDTLHEHDDYKNGGILRYVPRDMMKKAASRRDRRYLGFKKRRVAELPRARCSSFAGQRPMTPYRNKPVI